MSRTQELLDKAAIARGRGVTRQAVDDLRKRGKLPKPDYEVADKSLWKRSTLEKSGILEPASRR